MADKDAKNMSAAADDRKPAGKPTKQPWRLNKPVQQKKFEGDCEGMKGKIFDCSDAKQADQFVQTCKALSIYVGSTFKNGGDMRTITYSRHANLPRAGRPPGGCNKTTATPV